MVNILLGEGFEEIEATAVFDILRRGGVPVRFVGVGGAVIDGAHEIRITADCDINEINPEAGDYVVIPGGLGGVTSIENSKAANAAILRADQNNAKFAAICAGPRVLAKLGLLDGRKITCYPGMESQMSGAVCLFGQSTVCDGDLITGRAPGDAINFALKLLAAIRGQSISNKVAGDMFYDREK